MTRTRSRRLSRTSSGGRRHGRLARAVVGSTALGLLVAACGTTTATTTAATTTATTDEAEVTTSATVTTDNAVDHDDAADHEWDDASEVAITLDGDTATSGSAAVVVDGSTVTITGAGTYRVSGTLDDGQLVVSTADSGIVRVILDGVEISSSTTSPFVVESAEEVMVVLADGSTNALTDAATYVYPDDTTDEPNAALWSAANLTIAGTGALTVTGNAYDGIASKDGLVVTGGEITVEAADDGIRGKDYLVLEGGTITVTAGGDALKSDNEEDATMGYVSLAAGTLTLAAGGDGVDATTDVIVTGGTLDVTAGGGAGGSVADDASAKGLKGTVSVVVAGGTVTVDAADDAVHSNGVVELSGADLTLASGDDGVHADATLTVSGGTVLVTDAYEGLESQVITISAGTVDLTTSDDGINVAGGTDSSGTTTAQGGRPGGPGGGDQFAADADAWLIISGGTVLIDAEGDGLDSNGSLQMTAGTVVVSGPTNDGNGAADVNGTFEVSGGVLLAVGSAGMAVAPSSGQAVVNARFGSTQAAGTVVQVVSSSGDVVAAFESTKPFASLVLSSAELVSGESYSVYAGGTLVGTATGWYSPDGDLTDATNLGTLTAS